MCDNIRHAHPLSDNQTITWFAIILQIFGNDTCYSMTRYFSSFTKKDSVYREHRRMIQYTLTVQK